MKRDFDWYAKNGFDDRTARYFAAGPRKVVSVAPGPDHTLTIEFDNGERRVFDCKRFFAPGSVFEPLRSPEAFNRVFLDENGNVAWDVDPSVDSSVHWENRIDICKDACYLDSVPVESVSRPAVPSRSVAEDGAVYGEQTENSP